SRQRSKLSSVGPEICSDNSSRRCAAAATPIHESGARGRGSALARTPYPRGFFGRGGVPVLCGFPRAQGRGYWNAPVLPASLLLLRPAPEGASGVVSCQQCAGCIPAAPASAAL